MNNPNHRPNTSEDDDDDASIVNTPRFDFLLNPYPKVAAQEAAAKAAAETDDEDSEDDDSEALTSSAESTQPKARRTRAARSIRSIFKRRRPPIAPVAPISAEGTPTRAAERTPHDQIEEPSSEQSTNETLALAEAEVEQDPQAPADAELVTDYDDINPDEDHTPSSAEETHVAAPPVTPPTPAVAPLTTAVNPAIAPALATPVAAVAASAAAPSLRPRTHAVASTANAIPVAAAIPSSQNRVPDSVARRGGITGPLSAFLAANYLSRRRHRRTKRETKKVRADLTGVQQKQRSESQRLNRIETSIRARSETAPVPAPVRPPAERRSAGTVRVAEVAAATATATAVAAERIAAPTPAPEKPARVESIPTQIKPEQFKAAAQRTAELHQLRSRQVEKSYQTEAPLPTPEAPVTERPQIKSERTFDTKKPEKTPSSVVQNTTRTQPVNEQSSASFSGAQNHTEPTSASQSTALIPCKPQQQDVYKESLRNGFLTGLVIIVLGVIAYVAIK